MSLESKNADETEVRSAIFMNATDANHFGNVHGGQVMKLVDEIAYVCAARYCAGVAVTAAVDRIDFHEPIHVGELLHITARVVYVGRTSMEIEITLHAEEVTTGSQRHTNTCHFTFVALENVQNGRPRAVPRLICRTRDDKARYIQAKMRRERGLEYRKERDAFLSQFATLTDTELDQLLSESQA
ncbi:MAG: acyl-CoA thioesterase [Armatimonadetes bacterium]|nr:acyl-CoA thioesterase [Armatimonadota bacterium]